MPVTVIRLPVLPVRAELVEAFPFFHPPNMSFWTYMLHCADRSFYVGHTDDLERRVAQHEFGDTGGYTADKRPVTMVWSQEFPTRYEALSAERQIKGWGRAKKLASIRGDWPLISQLARKKESPSTSSERTEWGKTPKLDSH